MAAEEISGFDPWSGWTITNEGRDARLGPFLSPVGLATVEISGGVLRLYRREKPMLSTNLTGRLSEVEFTPTGFACVIDGPAMSAGHLTLCGLDASAIVGARLDDVAVDWSATPEGAGFNFSKAEGRAKLVVWHAPAGRKQS